MTSIYDAIKKDHETHRALLDRIDATEGNSSERREAWETFYRDIKSHSAAEEEEFYSELMKHTWGQDAARHSVHEHAEMDEILEELNEMDMSSPGWLTRFRTLKHDYEHHMEEEEEEVFTRARKVVGEEDNDAYGKRFLDRKEKELGLIEKKKEDHLED
ncbi:hemerythrin domain-containing protein [Alloyangia pacifica]|uniref:Hemerythrin HHE cation binding domain-containing protein n=1 Tax=Alloyangia pacifica TaxID=311180 RepID=A0A1I6U7X6_9RHOB|nr:hemerythrin domain-containing protein [Alloyangia pacifica]SDH41952.1 Hemerythrin HHE cation binding domain-containing protein [Alloyangia pacifica]SFS97553.1 Hemerythrin HHE cation binding domain-containing protein [Alloyangia pacifica]